MNDQDKAKAIERANAYREMMNSWAWKDFQNMIEDEKKSQFRNLMEKQGADTLEFTRGFIKAFDFMVMELDYILNGADK